MPEYIERNAADKALTLSAANDKDKTRRIWAKAICVLHDLPAADVAPVVHGKWISWEQADNIIPFANRHECSACHDAAHILANGFELLSHFCPNCGAKMDKPGGDSNAEIPRV